MIIQTHVTTFSEDASLLGLSSNTWHSSLYAKSTVTFGGLANQPILLQSRDPFPASELAGWKKSLSPYLVFVLKRGVSFLSYNIRRTALDKKQFLPPSNYIQNSTMSSPVLLFHLH